jgi:hypothetical protein
LENSKNHCNKHCKTSNFFLEISSEAQVGEGRKKSVENDSRMRKGNVLYLKRYPIGPRFKLGR